MRSVGIFLIDILKTSAILLVLRWKAKQVYMMNKGNKNNAVALNVYIFLLFIRCIKNIKFRVNSVF